MSFSIAFTDEPPRYPYDDPLMAAAIGALVIGETTERFESSLYQWNKEDYKAQWKNALNVLLKESNKAALIVTYESPEVSTHLEWWPMYRIGSTVFLQNHLLFYNQISGPFSVENAFSFLRDRESVNEEGQPLSEWRVSLSEIEEFAAAW
jgi:hypothetical protein